MVDQIRFFAGAARVLEGRSAGEYLAGHTSWIRREPIGVVGQVTPVELPDDDGGLEVRPGASPPATPSCSSRATPPPRPPCCWPRSPPSSCRRACSTSSPATGTPAARWSSTRPRSMVAITGSVRAGMQVAESAAKDVKRVHLELGGKAPVVVFDDADLEAAAEAIAVAGYFNAGQDCTAATRVLAGPGIHDDFVAALAEQAKDSQGRPAGRRGRPARPGQQRQPARPGHRLPRPAARPRRGRRRRRARSAAWATASSCSRRWSSGLQQDDEVIQNEIFGPVITVQRFTDEDEALALGQRRPVRPGVVGLDQGLRPGDADGRAGSTSAASGSTRTSRSSPRCRTAGSSTPATARTCRCTASRTTPGSSTSWPTSADAPPSDTAAIMQTAGAPVRVQPAIRSPGRPGLR